MRPDQKLLGFLRNHQLFPSVSHSTQPESAVGDAKDPFSAIATADLGQTGAPRRAGMAPSPLGNTVEIFRIQSESAVANDAGTITTLGKSIIEGAR